MKVKYIDGEGWDWLDTFKCDIYETASPYKGYVSIVSEAKVKFPLTVDYESSSRVLFDEGYLCVTFVPKQDYFAVNAVYDNKGHIVEWYFDVLKEQSLDSQGRLSYKDLYLDVVVRPDFVSILVDEDELKEALEDGIITREDYAFAYEIAEHLIDDIIPDKTFMVDFLRKQLDERCIQSNKR